MGGCSPTHALDPTRAITEFHHTAWTAKDGAPVYPRSIVQTADGFLWIGAEMGLYRFDGLTFDRTLGDALPNTNISTLYAEPDGGLWIGYRFGGASHVLNGKIVNFGAENGFPPTAILTICRDADGRLWFGTAKGLGRLDGMRWQAVPLAEPGHPEPMVVQLLLDEEGTLWASDDAALRYARREAGDFQAISGPPTSYIALGPKDMIWGGDYGGGVSYRPRHAANSVPLGAAPPAIGARFPYTTAIAFDHDGALWLGAPSLKRAIWRDEDSSLVVEDFTKAMGLSSDAVTAILEDREQNIWIGTTAGIDRFRANKLAQVPIAPTTDILTAISPYRDGAMIVTVKDAPAKITNLQRIDTKGARPFARNGIVGMCMFSDGDEIWVGGSGQLWHLHGEDAEDMTLPPGTAEGAPTIQAISRDTSGHLWISVSRHGVYRQTGDGWLQMGQKEGLTPALAMMPDQAGGMWLTYPANLIVHLGSDATRRYTSREGLAVGNVLAIYRRGERLWVGGTQGLAWLDGEEFRMVDPLDRDAFRGISGIVETPSGELWLNGLAGLSRIPAGELPQLMKDSRHRVSFERFDTLDGLDGFAQQFRPIPTAMEATDGKIWFVTSTGVYWIDPAHIARTPFPPSAFPLTIQAGDRVFSASGNPTIEAGTRNVQIDYTATSLGLPERVRFWTRLDGVDDDWRDVGGRRQAYYSNLGPGDYSFRVIASDGAGARGDTGSTVHFTIAPTFYQTLWFKTLCAGLAAGAIWLLYLVRLRRLSTQMEGRLEERLIERERIARDLHDTLLQSVQGMILRFQSIARQIHENDPLRRETESALRLAEEAVSEGRDQIRGLRTSLKMAEDLPQGLTAIGERLAEKSTTEFRLSVEGAPRPLRAIICEEAQQIGREALTNAFRHAAAALVEARIVYEPGGLHLYINDDGRGMDTDLAGSEAPPGHWGIVGMRERANGIRGDFAIRSRPDAGTEISLFVPADLAYASANRPRRFLRSRRVAERTLP